jgi:hypothetical protein
MLETEVLGETFAPEKEEVREVWAQLSSGEFHNVYWTVLLRYVTMNGNDEAYGTHMRNED